MTEYRAGQRVRIEEDTWAVEGVLRDGPMGRLFVDVPGDEFGWPIDAWAGGGGTVTVLSEPRPEESTEEVSDLRADLSDCRHWAKETVLELAHAEQVAAKLVEVICRQERTRRIHVATIHGLSTQADVLEAERDAARAEAAALRESLTAEIREAEVARKHAAVLADLRYKVEGLRCTCATPECNSLVDIGAVLALLDEAQP